jgi:hypothetical protein
MTMTMSHKQYLLAKQCCGFNADLDPTFYLKADPDTDPGRIRIRIRVQEAKPMRNHTDPDPGQTFESQRLTFYMKNILK